MGRAGKRRATRRALTLLEMLVVMLLIGLLTAGGMTLGRSAQQRLASQQDTRKLSRKIRLLRTAALSSDTPLALRLTREGKIWRGVFVGRGVSLRPFSLSCDALLLHGRSVEEYWVRVDEHGEVGTALLEMVHGPYRTSLPAAH